MRNKQRRPLVETGGDDAGVVTLTLSADPTTPTAAFQDPDVMGRPPERVAAVPIRDKLLWGRRDIALLTGLSVRLIEREVSAGRMPGPDVRVGRRALWRPATIATWLDELARIGGRSVAR